MNEESFRIDHINIKTASLGETVDFYGKVLGAKVGHRPNFAISGAWLYIDSKPVIHILETSNSNEAAGNSANGLHHIAFRGDDVDAFIDRLERSHLSGSLGFLSEKNEIQVFLRDPNKILIEVNFKTKDAYEKFKQINSNPIFRTN